MLNKFHFDSEVKPMSLLSVDLFEDMERMRREIDRLNVLDRERETAARKACADYHDLNAWMSESGRGEPGLPCANAVRLYIIATEAAQRVSIEERDAARASLKEAVALLRGVLFTGRLEAHDGEFARSIDAFLAAKGAPAA